MKSEICDFMLIAPREGPFSDTSFKYIKTYINISTPKYQQISLHFHFTKIIEGSEISFRSSEMNQTHFGKVSHNFHYSLAKFHFDTSKDSKENIRKVTFYDDVTNFGILGFKKNIKI